MDFACFQVWTFSDEHAKSEKRNKDIYPKFHQKVRKICQKFSTNCKKTIRQSMLKLPRDKNSKYEPKIKERGAGLQPKVDPKGVWVCRGDEQPVEPGPRGGVGEGF